MFLYFIFSCFLYQTGIKLGRRSNEISFDKKSSKVTRSNENSWYFVKFIFANSIPDQIFSNLNKQNIEIKSTNCISKDLFNLYLTPSQVRYIISNNLGEVHEIESDNKIANEPPKNWTYLTIETFNSHEIIHHYNNFLSNNKCRYAFQYTTKNTFTIKSSQSCLTSLLPTLTHDKRINSITYTKEAEELNCRATGYVQKNTDQATSTIDENDGSNIVSIDRYLNNQGLDGSGVKVLVVDTFLDTNSTFFYDPNHPTVAFNQFTNGHRKIDYVSALEGASPRKNDHGTHTAGSIAGRALNDTSSSSHYNGCAPGARLSFYSDNMRNYPPETISEVVDTVHPHVSTNSWGLDYVDTLHDNLWDQICFEKEDTLFVFAAGNAAASGEFELFDGYKSLRSPGSAKNVLTVGATMSVAVDEESLGEDKREIYMTDEEDETTHLTKLLRWSVAGGLYNPGMKMLFESGRLTVMISRTPFVMTNTTVLVIDSMEQFEALSRDDPPYFVISTFEFDVPNFADLGFKHAFPVMFLENSSIPKYEQNFLESNYRTSKGYKRAGFSSMGTGNLGLMKPDIMCPGMSIVSARALANGEPNQKELTIKHGTSMATPICAGAAAIVFQYFMDGKYRNKPMNVSSSLVRSFMINCADPLSGERSHLNCEEGHGMLNLGKYIGNGFDNDNSHFLIGDRLKLNEGGNGHMMATFAVKNKETDLKITLSYLDAVLSADSMAALAVDIDLVVVSPSGKVERGNQRMDGTEEHYSTNERVVINRDEVEEGEYELHVFSSVSSSLKNLTNVVEFAITVFGPLDNEKNGDFLVFKKATKCIPVEFGECNEETMDNDCYNMRYGRSCQIESEGHGCYVQREIVKIGPYGLKYATFYYPPSEERMSVTYRITPVSNFEAKIWAFYDNVRTAGSEVEADVISVRNGFASTYHYDPLYLPTSEEYMLVVIYNTSPYPTDFVITSDVTPYVEPLPSDESTESGSDSSNGDSGANSNWKDIAIISFCLAGVFAILSITLIIILVVFIVKKKKGNDKSATTPNIHNSLLSSSNF